MKHLTRAVATFVAAALAVLVLAGCVAKPPSEGIILGKTYTAAYDEHYTVEVQTYEYGCHYAYVYDYFEEEYVNKYVCEFYTGYHGATEPRVRHHPDNWTILFEGLNSDKEMVNRTISVSQSEFDQAREGYSITVEDDKAFISSR